jgi:transposase-like protein
MSTSKTRFRREIKLQAVDDYVSGRKTAAQVAAAVGTSPGAIYKWKVWADEHAKGERMAALEADGHDVAAARRIQQLEAELAEYQKKVGEQAVVIDLLKKLQTSPSSRPASVVSGLIDTMPSSGRRRKRVRS